MADVVVVRRTGGFIGRAVEGSVELGTDPALDDPAAAELRTLVARTDLTTARGGPPHPDMYVYAFDLAGPTAEVPEQHLTPDLRRIADLVLAAAG